MPRHRGLFEEFSPEQVPVKSRRALAGAGLFLALLGVIFFFIRALCQFEGPGSLPFWSVFAFAVIVVLLFTTSCSDFMYRRYRLPEDTPKPRHVKCSSAKGLALKHSLPDQLRPAQENHHRCSPLVRTVRPFLC